MSFFGIRTLFLLTCFGISIASVQARDVWKVAGKSHYGDEPPRLQLDNVQLFNPRTGKLSEVIRQKPTLPNAKALEEHLQENELEHTLKQAENAQTPIIKPISEKEQARRDNCEHAQKQLQKAQENQNQQDIQQFEADVVEHCIAA